MNQFKQSLIDELKAFVGKGPFPPDDLLKEVEEPIVRKNISRTLRIINNDLVPEGFFLKRVSRLGRSNKALYVVEKTQ
jgi:hypothetical protein